MEANGQEEREDEPEDAVVDRRAEAPSPVSCPRPDGSRAGDESGETRQARQPPAGTVEDAAAAVHRASLPQKVRQILPRLRFIRRGSVASRTGGGRSQARGQEAPPRGDAMREHENMGKKPRGKGVWDALLPL